MSYQHPTYSKWGVACYHVPMRKSLKKEYILQENKKLKQLVYLLKMENIQHLKDKVILQDYIFDMDLKHFVNTYVDKGKNTIVKW